MSDDLAARVAALERQLEILRDEMDERIVAAAHRLRDDKSFIGPFWTGGVDHVGDDIVTRAGRKVFLWIVTGIAGALLMWAGSTRFWTA